jgi:aryl-alcohol dehydrogenase-like predicted oxidoreductase
MYTAHLGRDGPVVSQIGLGCMAMSDVYGPSDESESITRSYSATASQVATAWVMSRGADIVPLIGTRRRSQLAESLKALDLKMSPDDLAQIERAVPADAVAGTRYGEEQMRWLDSEKPATQA